MMTTNVKKSSLSYADCERIHTAINDNKLYITDKTSIFDSNVKRGQVYIADLGSGLGSEQKGIRPVLIIQNDTGNQFSKTVLIVPITSASKKEIPTHLKLRKGTAGLTKDSTLIFEQMRTVDKSRLRNCIGDLPNELMAAVNNKIMIQVGIG